MSAMRNPERRGPIVVYVHEDRTATLYNRGHKSDGDEALLEALDVLRAEVARRGLRPSNDLTALRVELAYAEDIARCRGEENERLRARLRVDGEAE